MKSGRRSALFAGLTVYGDWKYSDRPPQAIASTPKPAIWIFWWSLRRGARLGPWLKQYFEFKSALETLFERRVDLVMAAALKHPRY